MGVLYWAESATFGGTDTLKTRSAAVRKQQLERLHGLLQQQMSIERDVLSVVSELEQATISTSHELKVVLKDRSANNTDTC